MKQQHLKLTNLRRQQGMALAISLIFLVLITIIGVSTMRSTTMNEVIASNAQQKSITFQVSESVIEGIWDTGFILENTPTDPNNDPYPAEAVATDKDNIPFANRFDKGAGSITATGSIQYCGEDFRLLGYEQSADESKPAFVAHTYSIRGVGEIPAANTYSEHDQRGYLVRPEAGRTGNCP